MAAARDALTQRESCIGAVTISCQQAPGGASTMGIISAVPESGPFGTSASIARIGTP